MSDDDSGRLCVVCGLRFPESQPRNEPGAGCPTPDICSIDMTLREAMEYWRAEYYKLREKIEAQKSPPPEGRE